MIIILQYVENSSIVVRTDCACPFCGLLLSIPGEQQVVHTEGLIKVDQSQLLHQGL